MDKRYQIFVSSTFNDLERERMILIQTILRKGYYPAGMEWFPGIDEEQFEYIKQVIDDSDYFVLILGGLYGTISSDEKSYTEKEFDYAMSKNKKIISLVKKNPVITEHEDEKKIKYASFHKKVMDCRLVSIWETQEELSSKFLTSLEQTIKKFPTQGWVRCNSAVCTERLEFIDINSKISSINVESVKTIHIMASGTASYIPTVKNLLKINKGKKNRLVHIYIYFRLGNDEKRIKNFEDQVDKWWSTIKKEYSRIKFHFVCITDFEISFRGIVINRECGLIGFYVRDNSITTGTMEDCIYVDKKTNAGMYFIDCF